MRSAEALLCRGLLAALCGAAAGCAPLGAPLGGPPVGPGQSAAAEGLQAQAPTRTPLASMLSDERRAAAYRGAPAPAAAEPGGLPSAPELIALPPRPEQAPGLPPVPVELTVQRAFDEARAALRAGRVEEARRGFESLARAHPELGGVQANLGLIHRQAGRAAEAVAALEKAVRANPRQPLYLNQLGIAYREQGRFDAARAAYEKAIELDPRYAAPVLNLGILHDLYYGDGTRALELYERYLAVAPGPDDSVDKWIADLKNRRQGPGLRAAKREQP